MSSPTLTTIIFRDNHAFGSGGALDCGTGTPQVRGCLFVNNHADSMGGAVISSSSSGAIHDCVFNGNTTNPVNSYGGGLACFGFMTIVNCTFHDCSSALGGGLSIVKYSSADIIHCTFSGNHATVGSGIGLYYANSFTIANSIIAFGKTGEAVSGTGSVTILNCNVYGNTGGDWVGPIAGMNGINGNLSVDPLFVDAAMGDCHIRYDSPCRETGDSAFPGLPALDFEGDPRIALGAADMGADEFHCHLYQTGDAVPGGIIQLKFAGVPGTTPLGFWISAGALHQPLPSMWGDWYLAFPILGPVVLGMIPSPDGVFILPAALPPTVPGPYSICIQALEGSELTNLCEMNVL